MAAQGSGLVLLGSDAGAGGAFEGGGGLLEFGSNVLGGEERQGVEGFAEGGDVGLGGCVIGLCEASGDVLGGCGGLVPGVGTAACRSGGCWAVEVGEAFADLGKGEVWGEFGAGVPDGLTHGVGIACEGDLVAAYVAGREVLDVHLHAFGAGEDAQELVGAGGDRDRGADSGAQALAGGPLVTGPEGLLLLSPGGAFRGGAVAAYDLLEAVVLLDGSQFIVGGEVVVPVPGGAKVAADLGGGDVDVVVGVAYGDPAAAVQVALGCDAGGRHNPAGDVAPLVVAQDPVLG